MAGATHCPARTEAAGVRRAHGTAPVRTGPPPGALAARAPSGAWPTRPFVPQNRHTGI